MISRRLSIALASAALSAALVFPAGAGAYSVFLTLPTASGFTTTTSDVTMRAKDQLAGIPLKSFSFKGSLSNPGSLGSSSRPTISAASLSKLVDANSPRIFSAFVSGATIPSAAVWINEVVGNRPTTTVLKYCFTNVTFSKQEQITLTGGNPTEETVEFSFGSVVMAQTTLDTRTGSVLAPVRAGYDLVASRIMGLTTLPVTSC